MTTSVDAHHERPRSHGVPHPRKALLRWGRYVARVILRVVWRITLWHPERMPRGGPVIAAANHVGYSDGPLLAIMSPRPVYALTKIEMFQGFLGWLLTNAGQLPLHRFEVDVAAVRMSLRVLRDDNVLGIFPEGARGGGEFQRFHRGAAYFAMVSGAPIVPVVFFGTRKPGGDSGSIPAPGTRVDIWYGEPFQVARVPWPRTRSAVDALSVRLRDHMQEQLRAALRETGRTLPGPLPAGQQEAEPEGITEKPL